MADTPPIPSILQQAFSALRTVAPSSPPRGSGKTKALIDGMIEQAMIENPIPPYLSGAYRITSDDTGKVSFTLIDLSSDEVKAATDYVAAEIEAWCKRARACPPGTRLWVSDPRHDDAFMGWKHSIAILPPGRPAPTAGTVYGPWNAE